MQHKNTPRTSHMEGRVGRLEGAVETLSKEVQETSQSIRDLAESTNRNLTELTKSISTLKDQFLDKIDKSTKTDWNLIIMIGTSILTMFVLAGSVIGVVLTGQGNALESNKAAIIQLQQNMYQERYEAGRYDEWKEQSCTKLQELVNTINRLHYIPDTQRNQHSIQNE